MDLEVIKNVIHSFLKMCDFIEETDDIGCSKCPVYKECCYGKKHDGLSNLMVELKIEKTQGK